MMTDEIDRAAGCSDHADERPRLLIAEDEFIIRAALADHLQECGFKVFEASTAAEAIKIIQSSEIHFDLVFCDIMMPGLVNGLGLALWIRANRPGLPIILTSGDPDKAAAAKKLFESETFIPKPYDLDGVVAQIRAIVGVEQAAA